MSEALLDGTFVAMRSKLTLIVFGKEVAERHDTVKKWKELMILVGIALGRPYVEAFEGMPEAGLVQDSQKRRSIIDCIRAD